MNVVDSSAWLEYFADGQNADFFAPSIENTSELIVPTLSVLEVFKKILRDRDEDSALQVIAQMRQGHIVDLDHDIALLSAHIGLKHGLPLADSVMLATARTYRATLWTQDSDFKGIKGVRYKDKRPAKRAPHRSK